MNLHQIASKTQVFDGASIHFASKGEAKSTGAASDSQGAKPTLLLHDLMAGTRAIAALDPFSEETKKTP